jgi:hypothetical protein
LFKSGAGSVSAVLILLVAPLLVFHAALIDSARIKLAERETETATKAGLRSALSAFDPELQRYGLYAVGHTQDESEALFRHVFEENLRGAETGGFRLASAEYSEASVKPLYTLANWSVLERQILEEMKYRAPIEFAFQVLDKLRNGTNTESMLRGAVQYSVRAKQIGEKMDERDRILDEAWRTSLSLTQKINAMRNSYAAKLNEIYSLAQRIGVQDAEELRRNISALREQASGLETAISQQRSALADLLRNAVNAGEQAAQMMMAIAAMEQNLAALYAKISEMETILQLIAQYMVLMSTAKLEAEKDRDTVEQLARDILQQIDRAAETDAQIRELAAAPTEADSGISAEALASATMEDAYYIRYRSGISGIAALFNGFQTALEATQPFIGKYPFDSVRKAELDASIEAFAHKTAQFSAEQRLAEERRAAKAEELGRRTGQERERLDSVLDQARQTAILCSAGDEAYYRKLEIGETGSGMPLFQKYMEYNRVTAGPKAEAPKIGKPDEIGRHTFGLAEQMLERLANAAGQMRDELYVNEFALAKFNYRTYGIEKGNDGQAISDPERAKKLSHVLQGQEAEYLLYGLNSCMANLSAAYAEMFSLRLAVRTAEALMSPDRNVLSFGSPLLTLAWALAEGASAAFADMGKLTNGEEVPVTAKGPDTVTMNYKDYLRLFMLLHTKREPMLARMQSLIELNTGRQLELAAASIQASAETKIRLWFMPYTLSVFGNEIEGNRAVIRKTAGLSY